MAIRHLRALVSCSHKRRSQSSHPLAVRYFATTSPPSGSSLPPLNADRIAVPVKDKLKQLHNPDPRFLKHSCLRPSLKDHTPILVSPPTRVTTLPNGLRIATEANPAVKTATVGVWIDAGSRFETHETNGTAHFLEHMIFKGTEKRTERELEDELENIGGHLGAHTSREETAYYAKVMDKDVPKALDVLADILLNSKFDENQLNQERDVILREREEVQGQAEEVIFDHLHATAFQRTPLGRTITGPAENIKTITKDRIQKYISRHYTTPRMVIAASGAVKHEELVEQVKKLFAKLSTNPTTTSELVAKEPAFFSGSEVRLIDGDVPFAQFAVAFNGASWKDPDFIALMVMQAMLECQYGARNHMGSKVAQRVGLYEIAESMMVFRDNYKDAGLFGVYAIAKPDCLDDLAKEIMYEMRKLCYQVSEDDVACARNKVKSSLALRMDGTTPVAEDIGRQLLAYGRRIPVAEWFARIDAVDASTIKRVANRFIFDQDVAVSAMGPVERLPDYNWFSRWTH